MKNNLNIFCKQIQLHPREAKSHFEIVDPGVWRVGKLGELSDLGSDWDGPYEFQLDGEDYEVYGLRSRIESSKRLFLMDLGVPAERSLNPSIIYVSLSIGLLLIMGGIIWCMNSDGSRSGSEEWVRNNDSSPIDELFARAEKRRVENHQANRATTPVPANRIVNSILHHQDGQTRTNVSRPSESTVAKALKAFKSKQCDLGLSLAEKLSDAEFTPEIMYYIGMCHKEGWGVTHDAKLAFEWFSDAAKGGNAAAQTELGEAYEKGFGVAVNLPDAFHWYSLAAAHGNALANCKVGILLDEGRGVVANSADAAKYFRRGANLGNAHSAYLLANLYAEGRGVPESKTEAESWYRKAASAGHAQAGYLLGKMYESGDGVLQNNGEALYWYKKAGELGNSAALSAWSRLNGTDKEWIHPQK